MSDRGLPPETIEGVTLNFVLMDHALGRRVSVVGHGGKSTLSKALAAKLGLVYIELDALHWKPDWVESSVEELAWNVTTAIAAAPDGWIADGHYWSRIGDLVLRQADMVIWLDLPWRVMFWRMLRRSFQRSWDRNKICGENTETWRRLVSTDSLWWYLLTHRSSHRDREARLTGLVPRTTPVVRLKSASDLDRFYELHGLVRES